MTTALFLLRCSQLGIGAADMEMLTIGTICDMYAELDNDAYSDEYCMLATQEDMDRF